MRRVLRDTIKPKNDVKLMSRMMRAAEAVVGILVPLALPEDYRTSFTDGEKAIGSLLGYMFHVSVMASEFVAGLKTALAKYKAHG